MRYRVGEHVLDQRKFELRKRDRVVPAEPQVLSLLLLLVENRDRLVTKDELVQKIWDGRAVSDSAISSRIKTARQLLGDDGEAQRLIRTVHGKGFRFVGDVSVEDTAADRRLAEAHSVASGRTNRRFLPPALAIAGALLIGLLLWRPWQAGPVTVAVISANGSKASQDLARDLTAKLGMLTDVDEGAARLLDKDSGENADLYFQVGSSSAGRETETSLSLVNRKRELLWSKDFRRADTNLSALKQQMAFSAGAALQCALDTLSGNARLDGQTRKTYLNGCAAYTEVSEETYRDLRATFERVTQEAPWFEPGWKHLLVAESTIVEGLTLGDAEAESERARLRLSVGAGRRINPNMPELFTAQAVLLPATAVSERMRLADLAVKKGPDIPDVLMIRSILLSEVGRMREAVADVRKAARLDPLSATDREALVTTLASAGELAEAREELRKAERLWPGSASLLQARYLLELRFGDPKEAIRLRDSGTLNISGAPLHGSFLQARADPSPANVERALSDTRSYFSHYPDAIYQLAQAQVAFGREGELYAILLNGKQPYRADYLLQVMFRPAFRKFHHDPRFMQVASRLGLLQYWQSSGQWPDFCLLDTDLPYDCKRVGAEVSGALEDI